MYYFEYACIVTDCLGGTKSLEGNATDDDCVDVTEQHYFSWFSFVQCLGRVIGRRRRGRRVQQGNKKIRS